MDLLDLYRPEATLSVRKLYTLFVGLPPSSRVMREIGNDPLTTHEHMYISVMDALASINYQSSITAAGTVGDEYRSVMDDAPKPTERPTIRYEPPEEEYEFTPVSQLTGLFQVNPQGE